MHYSECKFINFILNREKKRENNFCLLSNYNDDVIQNLQNLFFQIFLLLFTPYYLLSFMQADFIEILFYRTSRLVIVTNRDKFFLSLQRKIDVGKK